MDATLKTMIWRQMGAAIDMLENAIIECPEDVWGSETKPPDWDDYWYLTYHTLFWLDLYLHGSVDGFAPPTPFTLDELDPAGLLPGRVYSRGELHAYLEYGREKCRVTIAGLTNEAAQRCCSFPWGEVSFAELLLYNMRHIQHHTAQLNKMRRRATDSAPRWVGITKRPL